MNWIIYGGIALLMIYMMSKGGGCCGGGHASHGGQNDSHGGHQGGGCCGGESMDHTSHEGNNRERMTVMTDRSAGTVQDPVCGMYVSKQDAISREINGKTYYFCSRNCADEFERKQAV